MFKFDYEECRLTFSRIYKSGKVPLSQKYYCNRFAKMYGVNINKHKEIIEHYKRFLREVEGD